MRGLGYLPSVAWRAFSCIVGGRVLKGPSVLSGAIGRFGHPGIDTADANPWYVSNWQKDSQQESKEACFFAEVDPELHG